MNKPAAGGESKLKCDHGNGPECPQCAAIGTIYVPEQKERPKPLEPITWGKRVKNVAYGIKQTSDYVAAVNAYIDQLEARLAANPSPDGWIETSERLPHDRKAKELPPEMSEGYLDAELRALGLDPQEVVAGVFNKVCAALKEKSNQLREVMAERDGMRDRWEYSCNIVREQYAQIATLNLELAAREAREAELERQRDHTWTERNVRLFAERNQLSERLRAVSEVLEKKMESFEAFTPALRVRAYKESDVDSLLNNLRKITKGGEK